MPQLAGAWVCRPYPVSCPNIWSDPASYVIQLRFPTSSLLASPWMYLGGHCKLCPLEFLLRLLINFSIKSSIQNSHPSLDVFLKSDPRTLHNRVNKDDYIKRRFLTLLQRNYDGYGKSCVASRNLHLTNFPSGYDQNGNGKHCSRNIFNFPQNQQWLSIIPS